MVFPYPLQGSTMEPKPQRPRPTVPATADTIPYFAGIAAALIGGIIWAVVAGVFDVEFGWIAWGIGGLVGLFMTKTSDVRGKKAATVAAACAVLGLVVGKSLLHEYVVKPAVVESLKQEEGAAVYATAFFMRSDSSFTPPVQEELNAVAEGDTISDDLWSRMMAEAQARVDALPADGKDSAALAYAELSLASVGWMEQARWHFSAFDALWFLLAVSTAWSMLAKPKEEVAEPEATA